MTCAADKLLDRPCRRSQRFAAAAETLRRIVAQLLVALSFLVCCFATAVSSAADSGQVYQVGVAKQDITPRYPVRLNGFGFRRTESEGVTQPIYAKALAISGDEEGPVVLVTLDSLGVRESHVDEAAQRLEKRFGVPRERIAVTFTHSHTTPKVTGACDTIFSTPIPPEHQAHIDQYTAELIDAMESVVASALADRRPSTLWRGVGQATFAKNRRPQGGPVDHSLPVLVVKSADKDEIRAVYATYACHCVTLSHNKISGDWAGYAQHEIELRRPGAVALISIGCGSDANPESGVVGDNTAIAAAQGAQIADGVDRVLTGGLRPVTGKITAKLTHIDLPLQPAPSREQLEKLAEKDDPAGYNAKFQLAKSARGEPLTSGLRYPVQAWEFGDSLAMVFLGGEICCDYAVSLRRSLDEDRLWIHGYANDFCAYIPSERLLREGGYGGGAETVYFALPNVLAPGLEEKILSQTCGLVSKPFHRPEADSSQSGKSEQSWSVEKSLAAMQVKKGLVVEAVAAEPLVADPVAIDFAPDGRLWVAEMPDYSRFPDEQFAQHGNVRLLNDSDGDGRYDKMTIFVEGLRFPTGVKAWRRGVIVCDAPEVLYFEDVDGDGRADVRRVLLTGFETHNAQARVNGFRWGLDNWLYGACGLFGGTIRTDSGREVALGQRDFRFQPDTGQLEPVTGRTQQGRARNDWGDWFGSENESLLDHYPLVDRYLARNPRMLPPPPERSTPEPSALALHPVGPLTLFKLSGPPGRPTSVCGLDFYRDELLGQEYTNNAFLAEPVNQLVHRLVLRPQASSFVAAPADDEREEEFLASSDPWFRPVQVRTGPDGCLYVVDMHRAVIEHQKFIPAETLRNLQLFGGRDEGRIYRIRPTGVLPRPILDLTKLYGVELVDALESPNGAQRDQVQELLVQRRDPATIGPLRRLAMESPRPATRLQALCTLDGLKALDAPSLSRALEDEHPAVRRHAVRLCEAWFAEAPELAKKVLKLADDADPQVQVQVAYSLGEWRDSRAASALAEIAAANSRDPYCLAAVWSSVNAENAGALLSALLALGERQEVPASVMGPALDLAVESGGLSDLQAISKAISPSGRQPKAWQYDVAAKLLANVRKKSGVAAEVEQTLALVVDAARSELSREDSSDARQIAALELIVAATPGNELQELLASHLSAQRSPVFQQGVVALMVRKLGPQAVDPLLAAWTGLAASAREQAFVTLVGRKDYAVRLLEAIEKSKLAVATLDATQQQRLLKNADADVRAAAEKLLSSSGAVRSEVVRKYLAEMSDSGSPEHGKQLFAKHCSNCHLLEGVGHAVGPDLAALTSRSREGLFESILDPNRAVDDRFRSFTALTADGRAISGVLSAETGGSVTLLDQLGQSHVLLRSDLESLTMSGMSLMPEGLERELTASDVNDVAAYLESLVNPAKSPANDSQSAHDAGAAGSEPKTPSAAEAASPLTSAAAREIATLAEQISRASGEEYKRIPRIWELAIAAGRRNDLRELSEILSLAIPADGQRLADWQIVVIGGGVVNGLSESGASPRQRFEEVLRRQERSTSDWNNVVQQALRMADDPGTPIGTRYDALRVLAAAHGAGVECLLKYAAADAAADLQMGAVQSLADCNDPRADAALVAAVGSLKDEARRKAVEALLQSPSRAKLLGDALASGAVAKEALTVAELEKLQSAVSPKEEPLRE